MLFKNKDIQKMAEDIYPDVYPIIERDRELNTDQILEAINNRKGFPKIQSERTLNMMLEHICSM